MSTFIDDLISFGSKVGMYVIFMAVLLTIVRVLQRISPPGQLSNSNFFHRLVDLCVNKREAVPHEEATGSTSSSLPPQEESPTKRALILTGCALGLQAAYLTWGVLQESLMTKEYDGEKFTSSQFLVFSNRGVAFCVAIVILNVMTQPPFIAPVYQFCFASFSNVMSSFCQYEVRVANSTGLVLWGEWRSSRVRVELAGSITPWRMVTNCFSTESWHCTVII